MESMLWRKGMPTLFERHDDVERYGNDVMHAHRMSVNDYDDAKKLLGSQ